MNIGSTRGPVPPGIFLESINQISIKTRAIEQLTNTEVEKVNKPEQVVVTNQANNREDDGMATEQDDEVLEGPTWTKPFLKFLIHGTLPQDIAEARHISRRFKAFTIINKQL